MHIYHTKEYIYIKILKNKISTDLLIKMLKKYKKMTVCLKPCVFLRKCYCQEAMPVLILI